MKELLLVGITDETLYWRGAQKKIELWKKLYGEAVIVSEDDARLFIGLLIL
jgi:hypothetical protein